nr:PREDICTED: phosphoinositide phosphatase SAC2-like [Daucus carota subsp. sativus]
MASEIEEVEDIAKPSERPVYLKKFNLYRTHSYFYMIGQDKSGAVRRVLKISRLEPFELDITEDSTTYSEVDCKELLKRIDDGNMSTGGLKFVTTCYGIVGFIKFLGPYYMLLVTKREKIGVICGHAIYSITGTDLFSIPNSTVLSNMAYSKNENRYLKLLCTVDLTRDFFFSYSYNIMCSLQKNMRDHEAGHFLYETMFVWNEFMTRGIRNHLKNTLWTVALVYGFFKQVNLQISGKCFNLILIARRSRHYAGTRYLKRGVTEEGYVANDVETEQIVITDAPDGCTQISSVVQNRGSIPLFWSQETSRWHMKPDIILSKKDPGYKATRLHFINLAKRYGNPIIILNLIKIREKRPRESVLCAEFHNAIDIINRDLRAENRLKFLHWDLSNFSRSKTMNVLLILAKLAEQALKLTGIFYCQAQSSSKRKEIFNWFSSENSERSNIIKASFQNGVLRTNCIDCLDRTNVAQFAYGLVAFIRQLNTLRLLDTPSIDLDSPLADELLRLYEMMGDELALQYGGSAAHNKIFCQRRGQWKAATKSQELFRILQRYYSNTYRDAEKQDAINVFLGHYKPHQGNLELWVLDSDQHPPNARNGRPYFLQENARSEILRSLSDGIVLSEAKSPNENANVSKEEKIKPVFPDKMQDSNKGHSESAPDIFTCKIQASYFRFTPGLPDRQLFPKNSEEDLFSSNFIDLDWNSQSENLYEEEMYDGYPVVNHDGLSSDNLVNELNVGGESGCSMQGKETNTKDREHDGECSSNILADFSFARMMEKCCSFN